MPILHVEIVSRPGESIRPGLAQELADRCGEIFGSPPGGTWVKVSILAREAYAENRSTEAGLFPVFVSILKAKLPAPQALQVEITRLTEAIAQVCDRPVENVHVIYQPEGSGRVAFGGRLVSG
jgi:phenylpyruvate tautomerase PptA (4-oxalocrotonate tautomerase family)